MTNTLTAIDAMIDIDMYFDEIDEQSAHSAVDCRGVYEV